LPARDARAADGAAFPLYTAGRFGLDPLGPLYTAGRFELVPGFTLPYTAGRFGLDPPDGPLYTAGRFGLDPMLAGTFVPPLGIDGVGVGTETAGGLVTEGFVMFVK
jgi:hypothetical protein